MAMYVESATLSSFSENVPSAMAVLVDSGRALQEPLSSLSEGGSSDFAVWLVFVLLFLVLVVEFSVLNVCGFDGDIRTWFISCMVVLDHATDVLALLSFLAYGAFGFATWSFFIMLGSTIWGVVITAGELLDDELERRCAQWISSVLACDSPFWQWLNAKLVHHTEDVVMPFVSLGGLIPILATLASAAETDLARSKDKDKLAAQATITRGLAGSSPQFILSAAYLSTTSSWDNVFIVASATTSLIVSVYGLACEAQKPEVGHYVVGGHYVVEEDKLSRELREGDFVKGIRSDVPSFAMPSLSSAKYHMEKQLMLVQQPEQWKTRTLMAYLLADLVLRSLVVSAIVSSWMEMSERWHRFNDVALGTLIGCYLVTSAAIFPTIRNTVGYIALATSPCVGYFLAVYTTSLSPFTALMLSTPTYARVECYGSTAVSLLLIFLYFGGYGAGFFGNIALALLVMSCAASKLMLFQQAIWPSFAADGSLSYRKQLDVEGPNIQSPYAGTKAGSPSFDPSLQA